MIDEKTLAQYEARSLELGCTGNAEIIRLARRYLALRENGACLEVNGLDRACWLFGNELDAAADRLIQEMLK